jgi:tRNA pseudouridine38-40 synthase
MAVQRYKLTIAYRGTNYHGWQKQLANEMYKGPTPKEGYGIPTIQETVARSLVEVVGHPVLLIGSSRTDAGVHAKAQVAHFDSEQNIPPEGLRRAVNHALPSDILVRWIDIVPLDFHAIRSTVCKRYQYSLWNHKDRPVFFADQTWYRWKRLKFEPMVEAAKHFVGELDFASFARPKHGRVTTVRTIYDCSLSWHGPQVVIGIEGNGFLWNMARIIVGTLVEVGMGHYTPDDMPRMLAARDRTAAGPTAPPHGLYLQWFKFDDTVADDESPGGDD